MYVYNNQRIINRILNWRRVAAVFFAGISAVAINFSRYAHQRCYGTDLLSRKKKETFAYSSINEYIRTDIVYNIIEIKYHIVRIEIYSLCKLN